MESGTKPADERTVYEKALIHAMNGWSIVPIVAGTKKPPEKFSLNWCKKHRADEARLAEWLQGRTDRGIAVMAGEVSGGLACRDFDRIESYHKWAAAHVELASTLPTVFTPNDGRHVYFRTRHTEPWCYKNMADKSTGLRDGELRCKDVYTLLPPSVHPNGKQYAWDRSNRPQRKLLQLDFAATGFFQFSEIMADEATVTQENTENTEITGELRETKENECNDGRPDAFFKSTGQPTFEEQLRKAIQETMPTDEGHRNVRLFKFARKLKKLLPKANLDDLRPHVQAWHKQALPIIGTKPFADCWFDFTYGWKRIRHADGENTVTQALATAMTKTLPAAAKHYDVPEVRLLVGLCRELQALAGDEPFYLSARTVADLLKITPPRANRWLNGLVNDDILELVSKGVLYDKQAGVRNQASQYRYIGGE